ncbi:MAG: hypothetical protein CSA82_01575 [Actinobacteria bacterium]|nr:MAG: hypothetical protein CSA82_01575 [Actinomycetota bacterium]
MKYKTAKTPLEGPFFEIIRLPDESCPKVAWVSDGAKPNISARTSITESCGWSITPGVVSANEPVVVEGSFPATFEEENTQQAFDSWLDSMGNATSEALLDTEVVSTSYPAQRLQGMRISGPGHVTSGAAVPMTITGLWPHGEDTLTPLFVSPGSGELTSTLQSVTANSPELIEFTERCQGAASVSADGKAVTALFPTNECQIGATIGNYDIEPTRISISGHGS